jgi:uncharacterized membrane protein
MGLKERFNRVLEIKVYELSLSLIFMIFVILFLYTAWPRFRSDAMSIEWYWYLSFAIIVGLIIAKLRIKK